MADGPQADDSHRRSGGGGGLDGGGDPAVVRRGERRTTGRWTGRSDGHGKPAPDRGVAELDAVKSRLDSAGRQATPDIAGWYVDVAAQGTFAASSFPGDDWAFVEVNDQWTPQGVVNDFNGGTVPVNGSTEATVDASICRSGSTTGTRCGVIQARNATVNYPEGTVTGLTRTNVCAEPGDSVGAWLSGDQAQGVTSGGSGDCTRGGVTFFQPINEILQRNNLTLVAANSQSAPADPPAGGGSTAPPATAAPTAPPAGGDAVCTGDVSRSGEIAAGRSQAQPDGRWFVAGAGAQSACLDAPDGAQLVLELQRWTGSGFRTVARAGTADGLARLAAGGDAGAYRYRVTALSGSGGYTLAFSAN
ncbi:S1 family peptidase [Micromonospora sp. DT47]|uniref:S1 family peptidase n=1 Tax=Micromonospora sp. DT47 TaxID=3393431 RepID=UPI003CF2719B